MKLAVAVVRREGLITTEGRRSGRPCTNPVAYLRDGSRMTG